MENKFILNNIRENFVAKLMSSNLTFDQFICEYEDIVYTILLSEEVNILTIYMYMELVVAYSDLFKLISYRKKENMATMDDYYYLKNIDNISNIDDLMSEIVAYPDFLEEILESMYEFYMLFYLGRSNVYHSLSENEMMYLSKLTSFFEEEKEIYTKDMELEDYLFHYKMKQKVFENDDEVSMLDTTHIIDEICGYITNLSKYNYDNYINNIKDLLIFYYEGVKFDVMHEKNLIHEKADDKKEFVSQFETLNFEEMGQEILYDSDFLFFLVEFYCVVKEHNTLYDEDGRKITYREVEEYVKNIDEEKVKEKMKYKKTRI